MSGTKDDQRPRTWSLNVGIGSSRGANLIGITKDVIVGRRFSFYVTGGLGAEIIGIGIAYQQHYNEKGLVLSSSLGLYVDELGEEFIINTLFAYQWPINRRGFLVAGGALVFMEVPYPVLSYEYRF